MKAENITDITMNFNNPKWIRFKEYNRRDVEVEMAIKKRLAKYPVPDFIWDEYHLDQKINRSGYASSGKCHRL